MSQVITTVRVVESVRPHPNADMLDVCVLRGDLNRVELEMDSTTIEKK
jgi:predicted RNA-binding protein with EMAP domain